VKPVLTAEETGRIAEALCTRHGALSQGETFSVSVYGDGAFLVARVLVANGDESFYYPIEARLPMPPPSERDEACLLLLDFIDYYLGRFFRDRDTTLPIDWATFHFGRETLQARGWIRNRKLDRMADELLGEKSEDFF
jgi:hypothetical protein